jgi:histone acetyltransferase (RNA polymerase elongator complex component)
LSAVLSLKEAIQKELADIEDNLKNMIYDLSTDHQELVQEFNKKNNPKREVQKNVKTTDNSSIKEVWREIANLCHPDKNRKNDPKLHEIFLDAKKHKEEGNLADLRFDYLELVQYTNHNSLLSKLIRNSEVLKESIEVLENRKKFLQNSFYGHLYIIYKADRLQASIQFRKFLLSSVRK